MISGKTIFISPLDWGLGHATRCVPIIKELLLNDNKVIVGVTPLNQNLFNQYFPLLEKININSYNINYSSILPVWLAVLMQWPKINARIKRENKALEIIIRDYKVDLVISDNRFGLNNRNVKCIFITHQVHLKTPFFSLFANLINRKYIHKFNVVWIPDYEPLSTRLSGVLSDSKHINIPVKYIGPKSALNNLHAKISENEGYDYLILLSGTEPQRSILEKALISKFINSNKNIVLIRGSESNFINSHRKIRVLNFSFGEELASLILRAETIICRSGYSTLMDLHVLNKKKLILIPTPGQTEQEYLANYWERNFGAIVCHQNEIKGFNLKAMNV